MLFNRMKSFPSHVKRTNYLERVKDKKTPARILMENCRSRIFFYFFFGFFGACLAMKNCVLLAADLMFL